MTYSKGNKYTVKVVTDDTPQTGSIAKIFSAGLSGSTVNTFDTIRFGVYSAEGDGIVSSSFTTLSDNFVLTNGSYLEGPIVGFKLNAAGSVLVYFNDGGNGNDLSY